MTKQDFDAIFSALSNQDFAAEINKEARELFKIAEQSEYFKSAVAQWIQSALSSITLGGVTPKPVAMMVLVSLLLGQKNAGRQTLALPEPTTEVPITAEQMDELRKQIEAIGRGEKG